MTSFGSEPGGTSPGGQSNMPTGAPPPVPGPQQGAPGQPPPQYGPPPGYVPPSGPPPGATGMAPPPPARGRSPLLIIGIIVLSLLLICGIGGAILFSTILNATQPVVDAGEAYLTALRDGDYSRAYDLSGPALQQEVGDAEGLQTRLGTRQLASWSVNSRNISNNQGSLEGTTTYTTGETGTFEMSLTQAGNDWKVVGIALR
jgi:hypothetical protein